jgi:uncharacterized cysteine cluster protein YcgN (CxxCxxCC family)
MGDFFKPCPSRAKAGFKTCAYRLLSENKPLFDWHPLISGDVNSVHLAGISVPYKNFVRPLHK